MILSDISIKRPVLMTMVILAFAVIGLFSLTELGIDMFPKLEFPFVTVMTLYPGAGPEEIETLVTKPIEEEVGAINGVKNITSISQEGMSFVFIEFQLEVDVDIAGIDVKEKVDAIRYKLPEDIEPPAISKFDISAFPIMDLAVYSQRPLEDVYKICEDVIKPELGKIQGLANIDLVGGKKREIRIEADKNALAARGLSLMNIIAAVASENMNVPSGHIVEGRKEYSIRMQGEFISVEQIRDIKIIVPDENPVRLADVAVVYDDFEEQRELARFNNRTSVGISLVKRADANTVQVAQKVQESLGEMHYILPSDISIDIARDRSQFIEDSVHDVTSNMIIGILLTAIVLLLFLHSWNGSIIAAISMPISIVSTFTLLRFMGFTLNMMTLMGLAISVGILVANSIVVLENIDRYRDMGTPQKEAASKGTSEIAIAVAAATLTNIVVFTPIAFTSGITGMFLREFGLTVTFATIFSLLISYTLTPMMASMRISKWFYALLGLAAVVVIYNSMGMNFTIIAVVIFGLFFLMEILGVKSKALAIWNRGYDNLTQFYRLTLNWSISHRKTIVLTVIGLFLLSLFLGRFVGSQFFPHSEQDSFAISVEMPAGSSLQQTDKVLSAIEKELEGESAVKSVYTALGKSEAGGFSITEGVNLGVVVVQLVDAKDRNITTEQLMNRMRSQLADIPAANIIITAAGSFGSSSDMEIEVTGSDMEKLSELSNQVLEIVNETPGIVDAKISLTLGKPELNIYPRREELSDLGLTAGQVALGLRQMIEGEVAGKYREGGDEYDIRVKLSQRERESLNQVPDYLVSTQHGAVPIARIAELRYKEGPTTISRKNKQRLIYVSANLTGITLGEVQKELEEKFADLELEPGYKIYFGGESEMMAESFAELLKALVLAIILTYMLMAAILESYKNPFIILLTLPLGLIGVILSLILTGNTLSMLSMMAMVMLVGIVVNNGILLIDYIGLLRKQGKGLREAILEACPVRLRPILMTNIATIFGMLPLALGIGAGGEFRASMAIVSIGGLITSTIFTLYLIPVIYASFEGIKRKEQTERVLMR